MVRRVLVFGPMDASACFACTNTAAANLPDREQMIRTEHWRVAHAFNSALPGWLVLLPTEAEGFAHLHLHLVPRPAELPAEQKGPGIFGFLGRPEDEWVPTERMDELGRRLRELVPAR